MRDPLPYPGVDPDQQAGASPGAGALWRAVERFLEPNLTDVAGMNAHGLAALAADILERRGRPLPLLYAQAQRVARVAVVTAPAVLARAREAWEGPMLLFKGPELAARYPQHARTFVDLDLLVTDAAAAQNALLAAGFREEDDPEGIFVGIHHLAPLSWPGLPLKIEIHSEPKWPAGLTPPGVVELLETRIPAAVGAPNVFAPGPAPHALLVAAHAWAHQPVARVRDLLDVGALAAEAEPAELARLAHAWHIAPVWQTTTAALDALLAGRRTTPLRLWARHVVQVREQTVLEQHLERLLAPFWGLPPRLATRQSVRALADEFRPAQESWREKLRRSAKAVRRANVSVASHRRLLGDSADRRRRTPPRRP